MNLYCVTLIFSKGRDISIENLHCRAKTSKEAIAQTITLNTLNLEKYIGWTIGKVEVVEVKI